MTDRTAAPSDTVGVTSLSLQRHEAYMSKATDGRCGHDGHAPSKKGDGACSVGTKHTIRKAMPAKPAPTSIGRHQLKGFDRRPVPLAEAPAKTNISCTAARYPFSKATRSPSLYLHAHGVSGCFMAGAEDVAMLSCWRCYCLAPGYLCT